MHIGTVHSCNSDSHSTKATCAESEPWTLQCTARWLIFGQPAVVPSTLLLWCACMRCECTCMAVYVDVDEVTALGCMQAGWIPTCQDCPTRYPASIPTTQGVHRVEPAAMIQPARKHVRRVAFSMHISEACCCCAAAVARALKRCRRQACSAEPAAAQSLVPVHAVCVMCTRELSRQYAMY